MRGNAESKISVSGKKNKNNDDDVAMKTNLICKYLYEVFLVFFLLVLLSLFGFWDF